MQPQKCINFIQRLIITLCQRIINIFPCLHIRRGQRMRETDALKKLKRREWAQHDTRLKMLLKYSNLFRLELEYFISDNNFSCFLPPPLSPSVVTDSDKNEIMQKMTCALSTARLRSRQFHICLIAGNTIDTETRKVAIEFGTHRHRNIAYKITVTKVKYSESDMTKK